MPITQVWEFNCKRCKRTSNSYGSLWGGIGYYRELGWEIIQINDDPEEFKVYCDWCKGVVKEEKGEKE